MKKYKSFKLNNPRLSEGAPGEANFFSNFVFKKKRIMTKKNIDSDATNNINNNNFGNKNIVAKNIKNIDNNDIQIADDLNENLKIDDFNKDLNKNNIIQNNNNIENEFRAKKLNNRFIMNKRQFYTINTEEDNNINKKDFININFNNNLRIKEIKNQNNINLNKNINNNKEMINRKPELPQLITDLKSNEIKNESLFQKSSQNFYRKKINFTNEPNNENQKIENKNKNIIVQTPRKVINQKDINRNKFRYRLMKSELKNDDNNNIKYSLLTEPNRKIIKNIDNNESNDNKDNNILNNFSNNNKKIISLSINNNLIDNKNKNNNKNNIEDINDDSGNLNINEIINQKYENNKNDSIENNKIKIAENNQINNKDKDKENIIKKTKILDNEAKLRAKFAKKRHYSLSNINSVSHPISCEIFNKINIFNAILISLNNNSFIDKLFKMQKHEQILLLEKNNKYCLSSILYYSYKFLWETNYNPGITKEDLIKKYNEFIKVYSESNCSGNMDKEKYCSDINNIVLIIEFIYSKLNTEFIQVKKINNINKNNCNFFNQNDACNIYLNNFFQNNISFISDNFVGFYQQEINCNNCQSRSYFYNMPYSPTYNYSYYTHINFDLNEVNNFLNRFNSNFVVNKNININLDNCFNYTFNQKFKTSNIFCNNCFTIFKYQSMRIFSLPKIFTIILTNNDYNFIIQEELDLNKYAITAQENMVYYLISILCKINSNEFILYNFNHKDSQWYSYYNGKITKVYKFGINEIPLVLIYQLKSEMKFEYKSLTIEEKAFLKVKFSNRKEEKMAFPKHCLIKNVIARIGKHLDVDVKKITIIINAQKPNDYDLLSKYIKDTDVILAIVND